MTWSPTQIITIGISIAALALGIANFVSARILTRRKAKLEVEEILEAVYNLLYGTDGYRKTRNSTKLREADLKISRAKIILPNYARTIEYEGHLFQEQGNARAAISRFEESIAIDPNRARPHTCLGLIKMGRESIKHFETAIELDPEHADVPYYCLGRVQRLLLNLGEAETCFQQALKLKPKHKEAHYELGEILRQRQKFKEAGAAYQEAISADSHYTEPMVSLGEMLMEGGNDKDGMFWMEQAMKTDPSSDGPQARLAIIYATRKEIEMARSYAETALLLNPARRFPPGFPELATGKTDGDSTDIHPIDDPTP
jgi:tetratricopeptide (TPR) repeat protein